MLTSRNSSIAHTVPCIHSTDHGHVLLRTTAALRVTRLTWRLAHDVGIHVFVLRDDLPGPMRGVEPKVEEEGLPSRGSLQFKEDMRINVEYEDVHQC